MESVPIGDVLGYLMRAFLKKYNVEVDPNAKKAYGVNYCTAECRFEPYCPF